MKQRGREEGWTSGEISEMVPGAASREAEKAAVGIARKERKRDQVEPARQPVFSLISFYHERG